MVAEEEGEVEDVEENCENDRDHRRSVNIQKSTLWKYFNQHQAKAHQHKTIGQGQDEGQASESDQGSRFLQYYMSGVDLSFFFEFWGIF